MAHTFRDIKVWQKAHELVLGVYKVSKGFPEEEKYGLTSQLRRSAASVPTNIVEGYKRKSKREFAYFLTLADSSLEETKYHLLLAYDLGYLGDTNHTQLSQLADEVGRMLFGFKKQIDS